MAYKELGSLQETKELCEDILEDFQSIKISLGFLFEWRTASNETVYTQETLPSVVLDKDQVVTSEWEQSWDFVEQQLLDISEHNKVVSGLSLHKVCKVKLNWLAFQEFNTRNEEVRGVDNRTRGEPVQLQEQERDEPELDMDYNSELFVYLLYFAYRLHRKQSLPKPGHVSRTAFREFVFAFCLEWIGNSVANLANVHLLCQRLQRINVVVYNVRCNIIFENKKDNAVYTALLYWNGVKMLLIKNIETFLRRKRQQGEFCMQCKRTHTEETLCGISDITLGQHERPKDKNRQCVLLTMYCDLEAICPVNSRQIACCYSLIASTGTTISIDEKIIASDEEVEDLEEAEQLLIEDLFANVQKRIGQFYEWRNDGKVPVKVHTLCTWCATMKMCLQLRRVVGPLDMQFESSLDYVCNTCLSQYNISMLYEPVIFFHNFSKYDICFVVRYLARHFKMTIAGKSTEMLYNISCDAKDRFMRFRLRDSLHFVKGSIANFGKQVPEDLWRQYAAQTQFYYNLFQGSKGEFAYEWLKTRDQLFRAFPDDEAPQQNLLTGSTVILAQLRSVCEEHGLTTVGEYLQKYCTVDVLILMFYFDDYRTKMFQQFDVDIALFYSTSSVSWYLAMRQADCNIPKNMQDYLMLRDNIRGGVAQTVFRYAEVGKLDVASIKMLDVNSLYSWCMLQELPTEHIETTTVLNDDPKDWYDEMLKRPPTETWLCNVDLDYPAELHDLNSHFSFPLAPHHFNKRLCTTFLPKNNYLVLDKLLQFYVQNGLKITKWHTIQRWKHTPIFKDFIQQNIDARNASTDNTIREARKVANNALYGKTCENVFRYKQFVVSTYETEPDANGRINARAKNWLNFTILDERYVIAEVAKKSVVLNKPIQLGFTILELAKNRMYQFWYKLNELLEEQVQLLYTDTDSLLLAFKGIEDPFRLLRNEPSISYLLDLPFDEEQQKELPPAKVAGLFSDELQGKTAIAYVGLKAKSYIIKFSDSQLKRRTKGIRSSALLDNRPIGFEDFAEALFKHEQMYVQEHSLRKKDFRVRLQTTKKRALNNYDAKHKYIDDVVLAYPWGYAGINVEETSESE